MKKTKNFIRILASWVGIILISLIIQMILRPFHPNILIHVLIQEFLFISFVLWINHKWYHQHFQFQRNLDAKNNVLLLTVVLAYNIYYIRAAFMTAHGNNLIKIIIPSIIIAALAGIAEELIFRGLIFTYLKNKVTDHHVMLAAIISSLLFGLTHYINLAQQNFGITTIQVINAFALGMSFVAIYVRTKNLALPMFLHFFNDLIAFIVTGGNVVQTLPNIPGYSGLLLYKIMFIAIIVKSLILLIVACAWMRKSKISFE